MQHQLMQGKDVDMKTFGYSIWHMMAILAIFLAG